MAAVQACSRATVLLSISQKLAWEARTHTIVFYSWTTFRQSLIGEQIHGRFGVTNVTNKISKPNKYTLSVILGGLGALPPA